MSQQPPVAPEAPREQQTLRLPKEQLESLRPWAVDGTGRTAAARVTDADGRIALVQNSWTDGWFLPGGAVEPAETPRAAASREVREETGLSATINEALVVLEQTYTAQADGTDWFSAQFVVYAASPTGSMAPHSELGVTDDEIEAAQWFATLPAELHDGALLRPYL